MLKNKLKLLAKKLLRYRFYLSKTNAFRSRYKKVPQQLFEKSLDNEFIKEYKKKWSVFGVKVETDTVQLCFNLSGRKDMNIVPENIFAVFIEPSINKFKDTELTFLSIKSFYEKWFNDLDIFPKSYFHKIDGIYYDGKLEQIRDIHHYMDTNSFEFPLIAKPNLDTYGGKGVKELNSKQELKSYLSSYENFVCQEKIRQHPSITQIHQGINSVRSCLYRDASGKFKVLNHSIRFGVNGGLDNLSSGGIVCNILPNGVLNNYATSQFCSKYFEHPNSGYIFAGQQLFDMSGLNDVIVSIANKIPLCNLVSLDMVLDAAEQWRCLEINLTAQTIRFAQYAGFGFFNEFTDEVISKVTKK